MSNILLDIPELLRIFMHSVSQRDLVELLMDREKLMKLQIQDLITDLDAAKNELHLLGNVQSLAELRSEQKLQMSQSKYQELAASLNEELKASRDTEKLAEALRKRVSEKNELIIELNAEIHQLKNTNSEINEQLVELKRKQADAEKELDELKRRDSETALSLAERVERMETGLGNILNVNAGDLASLAAFTDEFAANGKNVDFPGMIKAWKRRLETENAAIVDCGPSNAIGTDDTSLVITEGDRNVVQPWTNDGSVITVGSHGNSSANPPAAYISTPNSAIIVAPMDIPESSGAKKCGKRSGGREDDLERKRRRVLAGGADAASVHACQLCGVVCINATVFNSHLSGKKHKSMLSMPRE